MNEILKLDHDFADVADVLVEYVERITRNLKRKYPQLSWEDCEDVAHESMLKTCQKMMTGHKGEPIQNPCGWMTETAKLEVRNFLRKKQNKTKKQVSMEIETILTPDDSVKLTPLENEDRRVRQGWKLSDTFREFVAFCEEKGGRWLRIKETLERHFLGEMKEDTILEMQQYGNSKAPIKLYESDLSDGWGEIISIRNSHDVHDTVFDTTPKRRLEQNLETPVRFENREPTAKALDDIQRVAEEIASMQSSRHVHMLIVRDTSAFCPSTERVRLLQSLRDESSSFDQDDCPVELLDVYFHCIERKCPYCDGSQQETESV
ncbi:hypothetical protein [Thalassoglobus sp.]|uniref:hypothetical protein n=1 Tax=Thalassoglobus sp. TaxID=2795869 RepID=UPI003AA96CE2